MLQEDDYRDVSERWREEFGFNSQGLPSRFFLKVMAEYFADFNHLVSHQLQKFASSKISE